MVACHLHPDREAHALCVHCGRPACQDCVITLRGQEWCRTCVEERVTAAGDQMPVPSAPEPAVPPAPAAPPVPPAPAAPPVPAEAAGPRPARNGGHSLVATVLALLPGLGHLYLGLYTRGAHILATFVAGMVLLDQLGLQGGLPWFPIAAIFFSVFDVREVMDRRREGRDGADRPLIDPQRLQGHERGIAYALLTVGGIALLRTVLAPELLGAQYWRLRHVLDRGLFSLLLIAAGVWLLRRSNKPRG